MGDERGLVGKFAFSIVLTVREPGSCIVSQLFYNVTYKFCSCSRMAQSKEATTVTCNMLLLNLLYVQRKLFSPNAVNSFLIVC